VKVTGKPANNIFMLSIYRKKYLGQKTPLVPWEYVTHDSTLKMVPHQEEQEI